MRRMPMVPSYSVMLSAQARPRAGSSVSGLGLGAALQRLVHVHEAARRARDRAAGKAHQDALEVLALNEARARFRHRFESEKVLSVE